LESELAKQVRDNPELPVRPVVFLAGGAPYALTTLMHPEAARQDRVTLSAKDIADYAERLHAEPGVPKSDLAAIADPETRAAAERPASPPRPPTRPTPPVYPSPQSPPPRR